MVLSTEWSQVELIELINEGNGLGFMLVGGRSTGVVIKALIPGGAAERDGRMQAGDHVLQINDVALRGFSSDQVAQVLRQTGQQVRLIVARSVEPASVDFQALTSPAPIIPTKLLADPEELERILQQTGGYTTAASGVASQPPTTTTTTTTTISTLEEVPPASNISLLIPAQSQAVPALVSTTITEPPATAQFTPSGGGGGVEMPLGATTTVVVVKGTNGTQVEMSRVTSSSSANCVANGLANGVAKRPSDIPLPAEMTTTTTTRKTDAIQCDGIDSTTTCSSTEDCDLDSPETEVYQVELHKNVYGLGITVAGYVCEEEDLSGIFVKSIIEGSAAEVSGIQINDRIVEVNGRSLNGVTNHQAVDMLRQTDIAVNLKLERFLRGRKFEHLQTALTEMRSCGGTSTPSTPMGSSRSAAAGMRTPRQSMGGSTKSMDLIVEEKRSSEDSLEESRGTHKKSKKQEDVNTRRSSRVTMSPLVVSEEVPLGGGGMVVIENEMESHTTIDSIVYSNDFAIDGDEDEDEEDDGDAEGEDDNELVMIEANHQHRHHRNNSLPYQYHSGQHPHQEPEEEEEANSDPLVRQWRAELSPETKVIVVELNKLSGLGISLEGTVEVDGGVELHPHHFIRSILEEGPVGKSGVLRPGDELLQVNEHRLQGRKHIEVVQIIKDLPRHVKIVCARGRKPPSVINTSQSPEAFEARSILGPGGLKSLQNLLTTKAQSESSLYTSSTATLTDQQQRSKSFEQVSGLALWTCDVVYVDVEKTEAGFGFSILDYQDPMDPDGTVIVIRGLIPGGAAEATNLIFPGDRLVYVNSVNLHGMTLDQAVAVLKCVTAGSKVRLGLCRPLSTSDSNMGDESPRAETPTT